MTQLNDIEFQRLREAGYVGALPEMMRQFEDDNAVVSWDLYLTLQGYTVGNMNDRKLQFWTDYTPPP